MPVSSGFLAIQPVNPAAAATGGGTPFRYLSAGAANQDATAIKGSAGTLYSFVVTNTNAAIRYLKWYNVAAPTSASTPVLTIAVPGNTAGAGVALSSTVGIAFDTAISFRMTTGAADADAVAVAANDLILSAVYK